MESKTIKALVLTFDKYRCFTDHMIQRYEELWPDNPFVFHIPYQDNCESSHSSGRVSFIKSDSSIKATINALVNGLSDEEWIYWCIDDKYPIRLDLDRLRKIHNSIVSEGTSDMTGLLFCRCRGMLKRQSLTGKILKNNDGEVFLERKDYSQIWIHQYIQVKALRHLFDAFPNHIASAKIMDTLKQQVAKPSDHRLFVTSDNLAVFGESTSRGKITENCLSSMRTRQLKVPEWSICSTGRKQIVMGEKKRDIFWRKLRAKISHFIAQLTPTSKI